MEGRVYQNPETSRDEQADFYENLRAIQSANNADTKTQAESLGTDIASVQGGLIGPESYFTSRLQTPQTNQVVAELRGVAQASAFNTALSNIQSQYQKRYQDAYRNYQKRASSGSGGGGGSGDTTITGSVEEESTGNDGIKVNTEDITATTAPRGGLSDTTYLKDGNIITEYSDGTRYINGVLESEWNKMSNDVTAKNGGGGW